MSDKAPFAPGYIKTWEERGFGLGFGHGGDPTSSEARNGRARAIRIAIVVALSLLTLFACVMAIQELFVAQGDFTAGLAKANWSNSIERWGNGTRDFALATGAIQSHVGDTITLNDNRIVDRTVHLTAGPFQNKAEYALAVCSAVAATLVMLVVAAILVLMRPSLMTWGFFAFSLAVPVFTLPAGTPPAFLTPWFIFASLTSAASVAGLVIFLACFPERNVDKYSWRVWVVRLAIAAAVVMVVFQSVTLSGTTFRGMSLGSHGIGTAQLIIDALYLVGAIAFATNFVEANPRDRQRISWVFVAIIIAIVGLVPELLTVVMRSTALQFVFIAVSFTALIPLPIAVAYSVLHYRVLDVRIAISRTLVYAGMSGLIIAAFAVVGWLVGTVLSGARWTTPLELFAAVVMGFWLNTTAGRAHTFTERILFRKRHDAEVRLNRVTAALPQAESAAEVDQVLLLEPYEVLEINSAAVFRRNGDGKFECVGSRGWEVMPLPLIDSTDRACLHLLGSKGVLRAAGIITLKGMPKGEAAPIIAIPILVGQRLEAFALYGGHTNGEDFDGDEITLLERLGTAAAVGYLCAALIPRYTNPLGD